MASVRPKSPTLVAAPSRATPDAVAAGERSGGSGLAADDEVGSPDLPAAVSAVSAESGDAGTESYSPALLERLLREKGGNISLIARLFGISRRTLNRWLGKAGLRAEDFRAAASEGPSMLSEPASQHERKDAESESQRPPRD